MRPPRLLLIGWDGADWEFLSPMLDRGELPALQALVEAGVIGNLATLQPCLSPLLWTSIATGRTADQHGILGFIEPTPEGDGVRPCASTSRRCKALWNLASQSDLQSIVVGWYASHPAEPIAGISVSEAFFQTPAVPLERSGPPPAGSVWPPELAEPLAELRLHPGELQGADLQELIPELGSIDLRHDARPLRLAEVLARDLSTQAVATALLAGEPWQLAAVYFPGLDTAGHYFMPFHPPQAPGVPDREFALYQGVMTGLYRLYDRMLAGLLASAGADTHVMLVSDHGFQSGLRRPSWATSDRGLDPGAAEWHRSLGIVALSGPGLAADTRIAGATLLDIAPTALALLGLPADRRMPGRVLREAWLDPKAAGPPPIDDWESVPGASGLHPAEQRIDPAAAAVALQQLIDLGYLPATDGDTAARVQLAVRESQFNLASVHLHHDRPRQALAVLEALRASQPGADDTRLRLALARCHHRLAAHAECLAELEPLTAEGAADPAVAVEALLIQAAARHALKQTHQARQSLEAARALAPASVEVWRMLGEQAMGLDAWPAAEQAFRQAAKLDSSHAATQHGLGVCALRRQDLDTATAHFRAALGVQYFLPAAHYHLAAALWQAKDADGARAAVRVAIAQSPRFRAAYDLATAIEQAHGNLVGVAALRQEWAAVEATAAPARPTAAPA